MAGTGGAERQRLRRLPAGQGISQREERTENPERAAEYVRMAAEQGNPYAQYLLGKLCLSGDGVPADKDAVYDWFQKRRRRDTTMRDFSWIASERQEPPNILLSATRLLYHMGKIFQGSAPAPQSSGIQIDRKRWLRRMRMAAGTRRTITSRSRRAAPCRWAGSAVQKPAPP